MNKLDKPVILSTAAPLKGEARRRRGLGRAIVVLLLATTMGFASASELKTADIEEKPVYDLMNVKLYLHNQINNWDEFVCANELGMRESTWRYDAVNKSSGAYGIFQHMSDHAYKWDPYKQVDKHIEYIQARYNGSWCSALSKLEREGWH